MNDGWTKLKGDPSSVLESLQELQGDLSDIVLKTVCGGPLPGLTMIVLNLNLELNDMHLSLD